jgi:hypothetical protein
MMEYSVIGDYNRIRISWFRIVPGNAPEGSTKKACTIGLVMSRHVIYVVELSKDPELALFMP